jgi:hypothetical protein
MTTAVTVIEDIRQQVAAHDDALAEARGRRDAVFDAIATFHGVLRTSGTGSLATGFINHPVDDGDGVVVLDRRSYPSLGPDGEGELPDTTVEEIQNHVRPILRETYPEVTVRKMKRGILVKFDEPLDDEQDPTVDLVVALNRREDDALWIPNLDQDRWDPSHPERHVELFTSGGRSLRRTRARVVRVAKAQVKQFWTPTLSSFNVAALSWEVIEKGESLDLALHRLFQYAASEIAMHRTDDPAGVSGRIKLPEGLQRRTIVGRLERAADGLERAIEAGDDEDKVLAALADVFPDYVEEPDASGERNAFARAIRSGSAVSLPLSTRPTPATRSHGGGRGKR